MYSMTFFQIFSKGCSLLCLLREAMRVLFSHYVDKDLSSIDNDIFYLRQKLRLKSCNYTCLIVLFVYVSSYNL